MQCALTTTLSLGVFLLPAGWIANQRIVLLPGRAIAVLVNDRCTPCYLISVYLHPDHVQSELEHIISVWRDTEKKSDKIVIGDVQPAPRRIGKASPSVSIFSRDPLCKNTWYCRCQPCDVGVEHDDHTCYSCEQRLLHPGGVPGAPWQPPLTPGCGSWCAQCTSQRCAGAARGLHELHVCMDCEHTVKVSTPGRGGDPWAAPE